MGRGPASGRIGRSRWRGGAVNAVDAVVPDSAVRRAGAVARWTPRAGTYTRAAPATLEQGEWVGDS
eukprot:gene19583-39852_t